MFHIPLSIKKPRLTPRHEPGFPRHRSRRFLRNFFTEIRNKTALAVFCLVATILLTYRSTSLAEPSPDAGSLLRQQEQLQRQRIPPHPFPESEAEPQREGSVAPMEGESEIKIHVKEIRFSGTKGLVTGVDPQEPVRDAIGRDIGFTELKQLADKVTRYLRSEGYLVARAYLPPQDVSEGIIKIAITGERLAGDAEEGGGWRILLDEDARIDPERLVGIAETALPSGSVPRTPELERALLLMSDLPGVYHARARLEPGDRTGTTRIVVDAIPEPLVTGALWANNYGNYNTGSEVLNAQVNLNDPWGLGDRVSVNALVSEGIRLARLGYDIPIGNRGLVGSISYTDMRYDVVEGVGEIAGSEGHSRIAQLSSGYPLIRTRTANLRAGISVNARSIKDDSDAGVLRDKFVKRVALNLHGDFLDALGGGGLNSAYITWTAGHLDLSDEPADKIADAASLRTHGSYRTLNVQLSRLQKLPGNFSLLGRLSAQWGSKNLDSSEEFILGGPAGVRAYPVGEAQGDEGWMANLDLRYDVPAEISWGRLQLSTFADTGRIRLHDDPDDTTISTATGKNLYALHGWGVGMELNKPESHNVRVLWASKFKSNSGRDTDGNDVDGKKNRGRLWVQGVYWF
uniref:Hemolysin activation/secretion protein n=1 Tax=Candidatus Kentrum sp. FM TaxID=2126340 RepID=A0A450TLU3_9GAMM|nr:MAG: Hemolysin activation/secretion protein [Candidatus Kentron sp. FM]VFJ71076.1 MAG: Hemolysin activation/secretion protein [Candidatus Kentron sp. FM]VFK17620.1 MAG: Hemolysin activation/secretion protein [Candidatus Kentron sp. FM]